MGSKLERKNSFPFLPFGGQIRTDTWAEPKPPRHGLIHFLFYRCGIRERKGGCTCQRKKRRGQQYTAGVCSRACKTIKHYPRKSHRPLSHRPLLFRPRVSALSVTQGLLVGAGTPSCRRKDTNESNTHVRTGLTQKTRNEI